MNMRQHKKTVTEYANEFRDLAILVTNIPDANKSLLFLNGLNDEIRYNVQAQGENKEINKVIHKALALESLNRSQKGFRHHNQSSFCNHCKKPGHNRKSCQLLKNFSNEKNKTPGDSVTCFKCKKKGHYANINTLNNATFY